MILKIFLAFIISLPATALIMAITSIIPMEAETLKNITVIVGIIMFIIFILLLTNNEVRGK